jgi:hypothetical protein
VGVERQIQIEPEDGKIEVARVHGFFFAFSHRARAALRASSRRWASVRPAMRALPPFGPPFLPPTGDRIARARPTLDGRQIHSDLRSSRIPGAAAQDVPLNFSALELPR